MMKLVRQVGLAHHGPMAALLAAVHTVAPQEIRSLLVHCGQSQYWL
jgi:hypothetical protein